MEIIGIILVAAILISIIAIKITSWSKDNSNWTYYWYSLKEYFFSYHENEFFKNLLTVLETKRWNKYLVFPKVRLADIMNTDNWKKWISKIRSKHVDYLIVDRTKASKMILAIELNWPSHWSWRKSQTESDNFKHEVFESIWLPLIIFYNKQAWNKKEIYEWIKDYLEEIETNDYAINWWTISVNSVMNIPPIDKYNNKDNLEDQEHTI